MAQEWLNVSDTTPRITYTVGATPQTVFVVDFIFFANADLVVAVNGVVQVLGTHYTASGAGSETGGTVTFLTPQTNCKVSIVRDIAIALDTHIPTFGPLDVGGINLQFSRLIAILQEYSARAIQIPSDEGATGNVLASIADRKNRLLGFGTNGEIIYPLGPSFVSDIVVQVATVDSLTTAQVTSFPASTNKIQTGGFDQPGDGGGASYKRVASEPSHVGKFQSADGTWWEIDEEEIDPLMLAGADDSAKVAAAISFSNDIKLDPRHKYVFSNMVTVDRPGVKINWNGATVSAAPGFTDPQLIKVTASNFRIENTGVLDGTNLPPMTGDFIGTDFTGITLYLVGTIDAPLTGVDIGSLHIISGQCGAFYARWCPDIVIDKLTADGSNQHATFDVAAPISLDQCGLIQLNMLRSTNAKQKAISISNSGGQAGLLHGENSHSGHAAVFCAKTTGLAISNVTTFGGYGFKADECSYTTVGIINADCANNGLGGAIIQGGSNNGIGGGVIRNFTEIGLAISWHGSKNISVSDTTIGAVTIYGNAATPKGSGLIGVGLLSDGVNGCYGTVLNNVRIRSVDIGISFRDDAGAVLTDRVTLNNVSGYDIKSFWTKGIVLNMDVTGGGIAGSTGIDDVFRVWSQGAGKALSIRNFKAIEINPAANLLASGSGFGLVQYEQIDLSGVTLNGGRSLFAMNLDTASDRVKSLVVNGCNAFGISQAKGLDLNSLSDTVVQVTITGNSLKNAAGVKQNIYFSNAAYFNGPTGGNNATTVNTPGDV